ncbi:LAMI_0H02542g1_1 [Lachancea mirantina]|uniref:LAMI_0H02542g1_1 n=1 Tax=Lachancea mirantina TaxID=1230905 RepID=A0A1G4KE44_9SACH|nr:LAMI_0H02542g1_1 [Lachancea mirantina]
MRKAVTSAGMEVSTKTKNSSQNGSEIRDKELKLPSALKGPDEMSTQAEESESETFLPSVSFDTVPFLAGTACEAYDSDVEDPFLDYTEEEYYDNENSLAVSPYPRESFHWDYPGYVTPEKSSPPKIGGFSSLDATLEGLDGIHIGSNGKITRSDYPTRPTIVNDAFILSRTHRRWNSLWEARKSRIDGRAASPKTFFRFPQILFPKPPNKTVSDGFTPLSKEEKKKSKILNEIVGYTNAPRTILCHVSGRKYTWVALDWLVRSFSKDVDHLVVISNLPRRTGQRGRSRSRSRCSRRNISVGRNDDSDSDYRYRRAQSVDSKSERFKTKHDCWIEWASGYDIADIKEALNSLFNYIVAILSPQKAIKVTVEIVVGRATRIMSQALNVYSPNLVVLGTPRSKDTDSLVLWKSRALTDKLCQSFPVPVILVPAQKLANFETELLRELREGAKSRATVEGYSRNLSATNQNRDIDSSSSGMNTPSSYDSGASTGSWISRKKETIDVGGDDGVLKEMQVLRNKTKLRFDHIKKDSSLSEDDKLIEEVDAVFKSSLDGLKKLEEQNKSGASSGRLRHLMPPDDGRSSHSRRSMIDVAESPKSRRATPKITIDDSGALAAPKRVSQIKFAPGVKKNDISDLERSLSYDPVLRPMSSQSSRSSSSDVNLRKVRSAGGKPSKAKTERKRSRGFLSLFKGSSGDKSENYHETEKTSTSSEASRKKKSSFWGKGFG